MMAKLSADSDSPGATAVKNLYASLTASSAVNMFLRDDLLVTLPRKYALVIGQPKLEDTVMPAPIGTGAVTYTASFTLERWDEKADVAEIDYHFTPDPKSMADYSIALE